MTDALRDGALATAVLIAYGYLLVRLDARPTIGGALVGALGTALFEAIAGRYERTVRAYWRRRWVQSLAVALALAGGAVGALTAGRTLLSAGIGALVAYVVLLIGVRAGLVPPPRTWRFVPPGVDRRDEGR